MKPVILMLAVAVLTGCAIGSPKYSCPAPEHGVCKSISEVYASKGAAESHAPAQSGDNAAKTPAMTPADNRDRGFSRFPIAGVKPGDPLRREARVIRVWVAPWVDAKGDYYDQSYVYTEIDQGEWLLRDRMRMFEQGMGAGEKRP